MRVSIKLVKASCASRRSSRSDLTASCTRRHGCHTGMSTKEFPHPKLYCKMLTLEGEGKSYLRR
jgi:hypothetical protein